MGIIYSDSYNIQDKYLDVSTIKINKPIKKNDKSLFKTNSRSYTIYDTFQKYAPDISLKIDIDKLRINLKYFKIIDNDKGFTSNIEIYEYNNMKIVKKIYKSCDKNSNWYVDDSFIEESFNNELVSLYILKDEEFFPKLIAYDRKQLYIIMTYCGDKIAAVSKDIIPINWKYQLYNILYILKKYNLYHNDITERNICILNDRLYLIDFGNCKKHIDLYYRNFYPDLLYKSSNIFEFINKININAMEIRKCNNKFR